MRQGRTARKATPEQVAKVALWAQQNGRSMQTEVANLFGYTPQSARAVIKTARRAGLLPYLKPPKPGTERRPPSVRIDLLRLVCSCGATFQVDRALDLHRHCLETHHRHSRPLERTPRLLLESAA